MIVNDKGEIYWLLFVKKVKELKIIMEEFL